MSAKKLWNLYLFCFLYLYQVQERVRKESITLAKQFPTKCSGQTPVANKTFTGQRKLYLFPGYDPPSQYPSNNDSDIGPGE